MKSYRPEALAKVSRYRNYFPTLDKQTQTDIYARMAELIAAARAMPGYESRG